MTPSSTVRPSAALKSALGDELQLSQAPVPCPADVILDALKLRSEANRSSAVGGLSKIASLATGVEQDDNFQAVYGATGVVEKLAPSFSKGIVGAGLNALVLGTGSTSLGDRHTAFATEVTDIWRGKETFSFNGIYRLTSLTQQVAVFWRTMARSLFNVTTWTLTFGAKIPGLGAPVAKGLALLEHAAATPLGRTMTFLNKWIPLLNAAWIMMAAKTAWDTCHDAKASSTSKTLSVASVAVSIAAVWAGLAGSGLTFMAVTFGSIVLDLLLAQTRHHDKTAGDSDAVTRHLLTHPVQLATTTAQWSADVVRVIGGRLKGMWDKLRGKPATPAAPTATTAGTKPQRAAAPQGFNPAKKLTATQSTM